MPGVSTGIDNHYVSTSEELQSALTEAQNNGQDDVIHIAQGTYIGGFTYVSSESYDLFILGGYSTDFNTRDVDATNTVLDGVNQDRVLSVTNTSDITVDGVTLQNGTTNTSGGGIKISGASGVTTLTNNIIINNESVGLNYEGGGGVHIKGNDVLIDNNTIADNESLRHSGGIYVYGNNVLITNNTISGNIAESYYGGGLSASSSFFTSTLTISSNIITGNTIDYGSGGGISIDSASPVVANNIIADNISSQGTDWSHKGGAGVSITGHISGSIITLTNNTIINNSASGGALGGGVYLEIGSVSKITNNIIRGNGNDIYLDNLSDSVVELVNNDFDHSSNGTFIENPFEIDASNLNNIDPLFVDAANGDYRLSSDSPLIDQGAVTAYVTSTDFDGNIRTVGSSVDIGAYEYFNPIITGTAGNDILTIDTNTTSVQADSGTDTAVFSGNYADYTFSQSDSYVSILTHNTTNQVVSLFGVEQLQFNNGLFGLSTDNTGEFRINKTTEGEQRFPDISHFDNGGYVVTWQSSPQYNDGPYDIFSKLYDSNGDILVNEFQVNTWDSSNQSNPSIATLDDGFVIVWMSRYNEGGLSGYGIYGQLYNLDGSRNGDEFHINTSIENDQWYPTVSPADNGGFIVSWGSRITYSAFENIVSQIFNADGLKIGGEFEIDNLGIDVDTASLPNGDFVASWVGSDSGLEVFGQMYDASATKKDSEFQINTYMSNNQTSPSIATFSDSSFVIAWVSDNQDGSSGGIYTQRFNSDGSKSGGEVQVNTYTDYDQNNPSLTTLNDDRLVVVWAGKGQDSNNDYGYGVFGKVYSSTGDIEVQDFQINTYTDSSQSAPSVTATNDGGFIVTWDSFLQDGDSMGVYAQRFDAEYNPLGSFINNDSIVTLQGSNIVHGLSGNDTITLTADSIWSAGYAAKNVSNISSVGTKEMIALDGLNRFSDVIDGGDDIDTLNLTTGDDAFFIDDVYSAIHSSLTLSSTTQGIDSTARIVNLEVINAGAGNDIVDLISTNFILTNAVEINGEAGNDILWGSNGNDTINGGDGNDVLFGGTGSDTLTGGIGSDIFQFTATAGSDIITDFGVGGDAIQLYYRAEDNHTNTNLSLASGVLTWDVDGVSNDVVIDLSVATTSSNFSDIDQLITFVEIV